MVWSIDFDDFLNKCCREPFPLLRILARKLLGVPLAPPRPGGDCSTPAPIVTPSPPPKTTTYADGECIFLLLLGLCSRLNENLTFLSYSTDPSYVFFFCILFQER